MSIYDFDDELPEDETGSTKKAAQPKKKGQAVLNTQGQPEPRDASRLNGCMWKAITTLDDVSLPKNVIFKAGLIALGELEASKRADIIARHRRIRPLIWLGPRQPGHHLSPKPEPQLRLFILSRSRTLGKMGPGSDQSIAPCAEEAAR